MNTITRPHAGEDAASDEGEPLSPTPGEQADEPPRPSDNGDAAASVRAGITLHIDDAAAPLPAAELEELRVLGGAALRESAGSGTGEVRVRIVGDAEMAAAHERYLCTPGTTDVITFDGSAGESDPRRAGVPLDVDLLVCRDEAQRQAADRAHTSTQELVLYILHGVLHCLGFDDTTDADFERMHAEEDRVLTAIGMGAVFGRRPVDSNTDGEGA